MNNKEHIENVIKRSYDILQTVYEQQKENGNVTDKNNIQDSGSRILFPKYRTGKTRFSEQELRFIFVEQLNIEIRCLYYIYTNESITICSKMVFVLQKRRRES